MLSVIKSKLLTIATACILFTLATLAKAGQDPYCFHKAGIYYNISPQLLKAISLVESNLNPYAINYNKNGTYDYCHMQINSPWAKKIGIKNWYHLSNPCYCTFVGAWILKLCIIRYGYNWNAVSCYHTGKAPYELPPKKRKRANDYIAKVKEKLKQLTTTDGIVSCQDKLCTFK